jgi:hypothetical protein
VWPWVFALDLSLVGTPLAAPARVTCFETARHLPPAAPLSAFHRYVNPELARLPQLDFSGRRRCSAPRRGRRSSSSVSPEDVIRTTERPFTPSLATSPRSFASSQTGSRGHDVRQASITSSYPRPPFATNSSKSRIKLSVTCVHRRAESSARTRSSKRFSSSRFPRVAYGALGIPSE